MVSRDVLFVHGGGGDDGYTADLDLAGRLGDDLGPDYTVTAPRLAESADWPREIDGHAADLDPPLVVVGHSHGAAMVLSWLIDSDDLPALAGVLLLAPPFWGFDDDWDHDEFVLPDDLADHLPAGVPVYLYHCADDEEVAVEHQLRYAEALPGAVVRELPVGGHQFDDGLDAVVADIISLPARSPSAT